MPIEFFLPDRLVKQLLTSYKETPDNENKGLLFTVDFVQDLHTHVYGASGTVNIAVGDAPASTEFATKTSDTTLKLCPHPPPCG